MLCSGNIVMDVLVRPVDSMTWGASIWVDSIGRGMGGNGANTACTIGALSGSARLLGMVGRDEFGGCLLAKLRAAGVDTRYVGRSRGATSATVGLVKSNGDRMFLHQPGASLEVFAETIQFSGKRVQGMTHYHLASPFALPLLRPRLAETLRSARNAGLTTSVDTQWDSRGKWMEDFAPALPHIDLLFVNEDESRLLTGKADPLAAAQEFLRRGARTVVAKLSARGCAVITNGGVVRQRSFAVPVVDTTGAGDCFVGAYLNALQRACEHDEAARFACGVAALTIQKLGAVEGLLPLDETKRAIAAMDERR
ncbi:MAG: carbohydrate kinase family protein [Bryobacteraceae bacterium]